MLEHHIQKDIVRRLAITDSLRFTDLKPDDLENKAFDYHLKLLIRDKLVIKNDSGEYQLTSFGRKIGISGGLKLHDRVDRADSVLFLVIRRANHDWLLYKRLNHPLINRVGFMHARPNANELVAETAARVTKSNTGLSGEFEVRSHGYIRVFESDELESFTHFTMLVCEKAVGELIQNDQFAEYGWHKDPDFGSPDMLPNMVDLAGLYNDPESVFLEKTYLL